MRWIRRQKDEPRFSLRQAELSAGSGMEALLFSVESKRTVHESGRILRARWRQGSRSLIKLLACYQRLFPDILTDRQCKT